MVKVNVIGKQQSMRIIIRMIGFEEIVFPVTKSTGPGCMVYPALALKRACYPERARIDSLVEDGKIPVFHATPLVGSVGI